MENIYTNTNATFTDANGEIISYQEIFDAAKKSVEFYEKGNGWYMDEDDLEDLFQDIVYKAIKYHGSFDSSKSQINTWVNRIAKNAEADALDAYNRRNRIRYESDADPGEEGCDKKTVYEYRRVSLVSYDDEDVAYVNPEVENQALGGYGADFEVESKEALKSYQDALASLNERYQAVLSLQNEGLKPMKMAERLGCSADAASTLLFRARKALERKMGITS